MKKYNSNGTIVIDGVAFNGVDEIVSHARSAEPKDGLWVGEDSKLYPCFDSSDYLYEDRHYMNFVFARSKKELEDKLSRLQKAIALGGAYFKLTKALHPMAYWQGEDRYNVLVTEEKDEARYMPPDYRLPVLSNDDDFEKERPLLRGMEKDALLGHAHQLVEETLALLDDVPAKGWFDKPYRAMVNCEPGVFIVDCKFILEICPFKNYLEGRNTDFDDYRTLRTAAFNNTTGIWSTTALCTSHNIEGIRDFLSHFFIDYEICESLWKNYLGIYPAQKMILE